MIRSPSFHCTVKQQAGAVDASTFHNRTCTTDPAGFILSENGKRVFIWKSRGAFLCVKQQAGAIDACIIEHAPLIPLDWSSPIEPLHSLFPNHNNWSSVFQKIGVLWQILPHYVRLDLRLKKVFFYFIEGFNGNKEVYSLNQNPKVTTVCVFAKKFWYSGEALPLCSFPADKTPHNGPFNRLKLTFALRPSLLKN